jgi:L-seryl-tRNA(Ser) seleniumtransferase
MGTTPREELYRSIPPVDAVLEHPALVELRRAHPAFPWTRLLRDVADEFRSHPDAAGELGEVSRDAVTGWIVRRVGSRVEELRGAGLRRVLNGTGVVLHTNLGRAPWGGGAAAAAHEAMTGYASLEVDLVTGQRTRRAELLAELIELATGAEASMVVNNNAAAVYLAVNSFSPPGRVVVSRGELVEIGGSFRLPEILRHASAEVVEVGTTNRTYARDYESVALEGDILLKVHKSNYAIEGFAHEATVPELVEVARRTGAVVVYDLGSGALFDFEGTGAGDDPHVSAVLDQGVDAVTMSGDKLMGGPQAGIIAGRSSFVDRLRRNPLRRALRIDKVTIAALQEVLRGCLFDAEPATATPALAMILGAAAAQKERAEAVQAALSPRAGKAALEVVEDDGAVGGGSLSGRAIASSAVAIVCASPQRANALARALRTGTPAVFPRVKGEQVRINMTTILSGEEGMLVEALAAALAASEQ